MLFSVRLAIADSELQIQCLGRQTMKIFRAEYGLSMLMWPHHHFLLASGEKVSHLLNRDRDRDTDRVSITQFRNGDELLRDRVNDAVYFYYNEAATPVERNQTDMHELPAGVPPRYEPSGKKIQ